MEPRMTFGRLSERSLMSDAVYAGLLGLLKRLTFHKKEVSRFLCSFSMVVHSLTEAASSGPF
jgi:hypothetical protein